MNDRCIIVLCAGRSGSSLVSGILHRLNVQMTPNPIEKDKGNPKGYYEDRWLRRLTQGIIDGERVNEPDTFRKYLDIRRREGLWGMKDPRFATTFPAISPLLGDYRLVVADRKKEEIIQSYHKYVRSIDNTKYVEAQLAKIEKILVDHPVPQMRIQYASLIRSPRIVVEDLCNFAYEGLSLKQPTFDAAMDFVDPKLYRCKQ